MKEMNLPAKATLFWLLPQGRFPPQRIGRFAKPARFDRQTDDDWMANAWSLVVDPEGLPDSSGHQEARIAFLFPSAPRHWLVVGAKFTVLDGQIAIARGEITSIGEA